MSRSQDLESMAEKAGDKYPGMFYAGKHIANDGTVTLRFYFRLRKYPQALGVIWFRLPPENDRLYLHGVALYSEEDVEVKGDLDLDHLVHTFEEGIDMGLNFLRGELMTPVEQLAEEIEGRAFLLDPKAPQAPRPPTHTNPPGRRKVQQPLTRWDYEIDPKDLKVFSLTSNEHHDLRPVWYVTVEARPQSGLLQPVSIRIRRPILSDGHYKITFVHYWKDGVLVKVPNDVKNRYAVVGALTDSPELQKRRIASLLRQYFIGHEEQVLTPSEYLLLGSGV